MIQRGARLLFGHLMRFIFQMTMCFDRFFLHMIVVIVYFSCSGLWQVSDAFVFSLQYFDYDLSWLKYLVCLVLPLSCYMCLSWSRHSSVDMFLMLTGASLDGVLGVSPSCHFGLRWCRDFRISWGYVWCAWCFRWAAILSFSNFHLSTWFLYDFLIRSALLDVISDGFMVVTQALFFAAVLQWLCWERLRGGDIYLT